ncbi:MAG: M23 family metallopeptidase, partial [Bacteroidota bacterium]
KISELNSELASLEQSVNQLHARDNSFYRSILDKDPISTGIWNGGTGGTANLENASDPEVLVEAEKTLDVLKHKIALQGKSFDVLVKTWAGRQNELAHIPAIKPVPGRLISGFGMRMHPIQLIRKMHTGIDMEARTGTKVHATGDGIVKFSGVKSNGYGIHIDVDHGFGYVTKYAHLSKLIVKQGQRVKRGEVIGLSGNTGLSKGPHLHYEIVKDGKKINPIDYFYKDVDPQSYIKLRKEALVENESMD